MDSQHSVPRMICLSKIFFNSQASMMIQPPSMVSDSSFDCEKAFAAQDLKFQK